VIVLLFVLTLCCLFVQEHTVADAVGVGEVRGESKRVIFHVEN